MSVELKELLSLLSKYDCRKKGESFLFIDNYYQPAKIKMFLRTFEKEGFEKVKVERTPAVITSVLITEGRHDLTFTWENGKATFYSQGKV